MTHPLGSGVYGCVYKGMCSSQPCALKVFKVGLFDTKVLEKELDILLNTKHPQIVPCFNIGIDPNHGTVMAMELLDESLANMLERYKQVTANSRHLDYCTQVDICRDISLGLVYLHTRCGILTIVTCTVAIYSW